jgi:hypothetical protein
LGRSSFVHSLGIVCFAFRCFPIALFEAAKEAALIALVADAGTDRFDFQKYCVLVAIGGDFFDDEAMA